MIRHSDPWLGDEEIAQLTDCIRNNWITGGVKVKEFEERIAELCQVKRAVACTNGTSALFMALKAMGIGQGDEVIVPDFTFVASANAVVLAGAKPVFVDVKEDTLNIDPSLIEGAVTERTKAVMPVHLYGQSVDMDAVLDVADDYGLYIIEDNAQGIGVTWDSVPTGGFGDIGCLSFYADKTLTTGEGGMVLTNDDETADKCLRLAHQGNLGKGRYVHETLGFNFRMTDLQAAVGLAQLEKLPIVIDRRRHVDQLYRDMLRTIRPKIDKRCFNVPYRTLVMVDDPEELRLHLAENGIETRRVFCPLHQQPYYSQEGQYPNSVYAYEHGLQLPLSAAITDKQVEMVCKSIKQYYKESK